MSAEKLYTTEMLAAAMELADYAPLEKPDLYGSARSESCGSSLELTMVLGPHGVVERIGMRVHACAVGQASAAVFARHAKGRTAAQIQATRGELAQWLNSEGAAPDWPGLGLIAPARAYRGRHGAMLLPWNAAIAALSSVPTSG